MRVLVCPDCFTGTLTADEAAAAFAAGWLAQRPSDTLECVPLSDGGPGFVDAAVRGVGATRMTTAVPGPLGGTVIAQWALAGEQAWIESAQACGLHLVAPEQRDPRATTTLGVGWLVAAAIAAGARTITVGVGGTGTNDGGAGMLSALGARADRGELAAGGAALVDIGPVDLSQARHAVAGVRLLVATDVDNPLCGARGASRVYGPQKGASAVDCELLDRALAGFAAQCGRMPQGRDPAVALGAGAGGGLGYGLMLLGATREPGIGTVMSMVGLAQRVQATDVVVTGEGRLDDQSLQGKVVSGVARLAAEHAKPCVVVAGEVRLGKRELAAAGIDAGYSLVDMVGSTAALGDPAAAMSTAAGRVARAWGGQRE